MKKSLLQLMGNSKLEIFTLCFANKFVFEAVVNKFVSKPKIISADVSSPSSLRRPKIPIDESIPISP